MISINSDTSTLQHSSCGRYGLNIKISSGREISLGWRGGEEVAQSKTRSTSEGAALAQARGKAAKTRDTIPDLLPAVSVTVPCLFLVLLLTTSEDKKRRGLYNGFHSRSWDRDSL